MLHKNLTEFATQLAMSDMQNFFFVISYNRLTTSLYDILSLYTPVYLYRKIMMSGKTINFPKYNAATLLCFKCIFSVFQIYDNFPNIFRNSINLFEFYLCKCFT